MMKERHMKHNDNDEIILDWEMIKGNLRDCTGSYVVSILSNNFR